MNTPSAHTFEPYDVSPSFCVICDRPKAEHKGDGLDDLRKVEADAYSDWLRRQSSANTGRSE